MKPLTKKDIKKLVDDGTLIMLHKVKDKHLIEGIRNLSTIIKNTVYLTSENYYGDGQFYFKCRKCGEELCGRTTEKIECICGHNTNCVYNYQIDA